MYGANVDLYQKARVFQNCFLCSACILFFQWSLELQDQEKVFLQQSNQVNAWDRMLADSGEKVSNYITPDRLWCDISFIYY